MADTLISDLIQLTPMTAVVWPLDSARRWYSERQPLATPCCRRWPVRRHATYSHVTTIRVNNPSACSHENEFM